MLTGFARAEAQSSYVSYTTISGLTGSSSASPTPAVLVQGYNLAGDGGGGWFVQGSAAPVDNCIVFKDSTTPTPNYWHRQMTGSTLSVLQCGAKPDNITDNTTAFQNGVIALINNFGGGTLYLPASYTPSTPGTQNCYVTKYEVMIPPFSSFVTTATSENGTTATVGFSGNYRFPVGSLVTISGVTPAPLVDFVATENEVSRGRSTMYEDESFLMPINLQSVQTNASGQVGSHAVLGSLTLADPQLLSNPAPLMTLCLNTTGHTLNQGDVVSLQANGGGGNYNNCIDPASYNAGRGTGTAAEFPCFIVTAPGTAGVTSFANGQPVTIALPGSQVLVSVTPGGAMHPVNSGALLLPQAPTTTANGSTTAVDPAALTSPQQEAQACAIAIGTVSTGTTPTLIKGIAKN